MDPLFKNVSGEHSDQVLIENVRPRSWKDPEPAPCYNMVVIGAGTAGLVTAAGCAGLGARVALVERDRLGGECLNTGCVPSKGIIRAGRAIHDVSAAEEFGIAQAGPVSVDFSKVMERMRSVRAEISKHDSAERFSRGLGIDLFFGNASFINRDEVAVNGAKLKFRKAAICTGSRAAIPPVPGLAETGCLTNETVFSLDKLPRRLVIIGGGPIGCELAQAFGRLGSQVFVIETADRLLKVAEPDAAGIVHRSLLRDKVTVLLQTNVIRVRRQGSEKIVVVDQQGSVSELACDELLVAAGRTPNVDGLGLEEAGVAYDPHKGVLVDDLLRTTNPRIYAAGDICSSLRFTHTADAQARIVIANALFPARQRASSLVIPWCVYTDPETAHVGISEQEARERGIELHTLTVPLGEVDRALLDAESEGYVRVYLKKGSDTILGATIVARHAGEMINELSLAMTAGLGLSAINRTIHPYPTQAEAIKKLSDAYRRMRLTPFLKRLLSAWFKWERA